MNITYNNLTQPSNFVTFTEIPNILSVKEDIRGTKAVINFVFQGDLRSTVSADSQYYITVLGETITNVMNPQKANNKTFYISGDEESTAMQVGRAFRRCGSITADFIVIVDGNEVSLIAKTIGQKGIASPTSILRNIPQANLTVNVADGNAYSILFNSKISVDVYEGNYTDNNTYRLTLEKNWYGDECAFDMSPVLATISEFGVTKPYVFGLNAIREDGEFQVLGYISGNTTFGYHCNQSDVYKFASGAQFLLNKRRGENNVMTLYTYDANIPFSVLCGRDTASFNITYSVKDSAYNELYTTTITKQRPSGDNLLLDTSITVPQTAFTNAYYVDITIGGDTTRFDVIKPLKATEYYQRVFWRNEYGGISFFDFTGARSESDNVDIETYEKNIFDYHIAVEEYEQFERKKIYKNDYKKSVSLTSHLMNEDGKWIFNSLMMSKKVWTIVNGKVYYIIPKSIEVAEDQTYNGIFTAKLSYEYSDI